MTLPERDFPDVVRAESARFLEVVVAADLSVVVPTCPDWDLAALTDHLGGLYGWVADLVGARARERAAKPVRDESLDLATWFGAAAERLASTLADAEPDPELWTWATGQLPVEDGLAFWQRRMAHETVVHRYDAELAAGVPVAPVERWLAADGIDELWQWFAEGVPDWMTFTPGVGVVRIEATDHDADWTMALGRAAGTTGSGREVDVPATVFTDADPDTTVRASVGDLHRWLWGRGDLPPMATDGNQSHIVTLRAAIANAS